MENHPATFTSEEVHANLLLVLTHLRDWRQGRGRLYFVFATLFNCLPGMNNPQKSHVWIGVGALAANSSVTNKEFTAEGKKNCLRGGGCQPSPTLSFPWDVKWGCSSLQRLPEQRQRVTNGPVKSNTCPLCNQPEAPLGLVNTLQRLKFLIALKVYSPLMLCWFSLLKYYTSSASFLHN